MDIKQLNAFVSVVEAGSFSKAGEQLYLTQPTVSSHIASLEQELNIRLLVRTTKEVYPSEAGKLLYPYAKEILSLRQQAVDSLEKFSHEMRGSITVAASTIPAQYFLPSLIQSFHHRYPQIKFNIQMVDSAEVDSQVGSSAADVGFTGTLSTGSKCLYREFADDKLVIITPNEPRFQEYQADGFPAEQLLREAFISREPGSGTRKETETFLKEQGIDPRFLHIAVEVRSTESIIKMVSEGLGVAVISRSACEDYCQFQKILAFDFRGMALHRKLYILRHRKLPLSPIAQVFYDYARDYTAPEAPHGGEK